MTTLAREGATYNPDTLAKFPIRTGVDKAPPIQSAPKSRRKPFATF
jgi:hypothetical protein